METATTQAQRKETPTGHITVRFQVTPSYTMPQGDYAQSRPFYTFPSLHHLRTRNRPSPTPYLTIGPTSPESGGLPV